MLSITGNIQAAPQSAFDPDHDPIARPLAPQYRVHNDGAVTLRICFNWSCTYRQKLTFTAADMAEVERQMSFCDRETLAHRLQRIRIGIWQMELLAQKYQPLLANDRAINTQDQYVDGRTDCVDNASNTTVFLNVLKDLLLLPDWTVGSPQVRDMLSIVDVHWTAVVADGLSGERWTVDSWFRPHGHLPFVMPAADWAAGKKGWEPPFDEVNRAPPRITELCDSETTRNIGLTDINP